MSSQKALQEKLAQLREQHRDLDVAILSLEEAAAADQLRLRRLKKQKLMLKDEIQKIEDQMIPDIIA